jgi:hypothetical protein
MFYPAPYIKIHGTAKLFSWRDALQCEKLIFQLVIGGSTRIFGNQRSSLIYLIYHEFYIVIFTQFITFLLK